MIGSTNKAKITAARIHGLQPDLACSSSPRSWIALVAAEGCVLPAGIAVSFGVAFSSALAAAVVRGATSFDGAAVATAAAVVAGTAPVGFVAGASAFSADFSAGAGALFAASLLASAVTGVAGASVLAAAADGGVFVSWACPCDAFKSTAPITTAAKTRQRPTNFILLFFIFISIRQTEQGTVFYDVLFTVVPVSCSSAVNTRAIAVMLSRSLVPVDSSTRTVTRWASRWTFVTTP